MEDIIGQGNYDVVHTHMGVMGYVIMRIAKNIMYPEDVCIHILQMKLPAKIKIC